jgi:hypothetical protein
MDDEDLIAEQDHLLQMKDAMEMKTDEDSKEDIMQYLECHDPNKYRKKIKGFHIAFNIREKVLRIGEDELSKYKFKSKLTPEEIKRLAAEAKAKRASEKAIKEKEEKEKYQKEREALRKMHEQMRRDKGLMTGRKGELVKGMPGYHDVNMKAGDEKHLKITFAVIEKMHYSDFNSGNDAEDFKPSDIIDEEDAAISDDEVLRKFKHDNKMIGGVPRGATKDLHDTVGGAPPNIGLGIGLKGNLAAKQNEALKKGNNYESRKKVGNEASEPYLIDPYQEKIHTLKNQL